MWTRHGDKSLRFESRADHCSFLYGIGPTYRACNPELPGANPQTSLSKKLELLEQRLHVRLRVERLQVVHALANADVLHRQVELLLDREDRPALGGAVELGQHDART